MLIDQPATLAQIVQRVWPGDTLAHAEPMLGGISAQVLLLHVRHADNAVGKYLVRVHGEGDRKRNPDVALHEYSILRHVYAAGLPVAKPVHLDQSCEVYPLPYIVVGYIEGKTEFAPRDIPGFVQQYATLLARIHQVKGAPDFLIDRAAMVQQRIQYQPDELDDTVDEAGLRAKLRTLFPLRQMNAPALLHGDFWPGNLIWQDGRLVGVVDWEDVDVGDPLADLSIARLEMLWMCGQAAMHDFTRAYQQLMPHLDY
ncbi:MAG: aminoglycoside phosphotransferase family protein, partial [Anaerolineae bacterium]|nr:aminoglycoside phosphotransferase family protein [Anaerolineae bacterium]